MEAEPRSAAALLPTLPLVAGDDPGAHVHRGRREQIRAVWQIAMFGQVIASAIVFAPSAFAAGGCTPSPPIAIAIVIALDGLVLLAG